MALLFTHVHKTAGASFAQSVIYPNVDQERIHHFCGVWNLLKNRGQVMDYVSGHYPYGIHMFMKGDGPNIYFTILREPLDRAVSYYYYVKQLDTPLFKHQSLPDANRFDIAGFYGLENYQNIQTKFIAGLFIMRTAAFLPKVLGDSLLLSHAKHNLCKRYRAFGLFERINEFQETAAKIMGWKNLNVKNETTVTRKRPSVHQLAEEAKVSILRANRLDVDLYRFAQGLYHQRLEKSL